MKRILLLESVVEEAFQQLKQQAQLFTAYQGESIREIIENNDIHAIITRGKGQVNSSLIERCEKLEVIARCGVGLDNVDVAAATQRHIKVINAPGANAGTIAEHTLTLMLMLIRNAYKAVAEVKAERWAWRNQYSGDELAGKTLGILGLGHIGKRVARLAEAFGMKVVYWNRSQGQHPYQRLSLEEVLRLSDMVSLHLPLTAQTANLIGEAQLLLMQPHAFLINTARGGLIDQAALLKALNQGKLAGYGADVLAEEPPPAEDPLIQHPNTIITPHTGSLTATTYRHMCVFTVQNVLAVLAGEEPDPHCIFNRKELGI